MFRFICNWFIQEHHSHTFRYVYSCYGVIEGKYSNPELLYFGAGHHILNMVSSCLQSQKQTGVPRDTSWQV